jgi:hypothetical protein
MKHTKYFLVSLFELESGEKEPMNVNLPMNTAVMLVQVGGNLRLKRLRGSDYAHKSIEPANPEQVSLL